MMTFSYTVEICMCAWASPLEVFSTDKAGINIDSCERDRAQLFKVKVKNSAVDRV